MVNLFFTSAVPRATRVPALTEPIRSVLAPVLRPNAISRVHGAPHCLMSVRVTPTSLCRRHFRQTTCIEYTTHRRLLRHICLCLSVCVCPSVRLSTGRKAIYLRHVNSVSQPDISTGLSWSVDLPVYFLKLTLFLL